MHPSFAPMGSTMYRAHSVQSRARCARQRRVMPRASWLRAAARESRAAAAHEHPRCRGSPPCCHRSHHRGGRRVRGVRAVVRRNGDHRDRRVVDQIVRQRARQHLLRLRSSGAHIMSAVQHPHARDGCMGSPTEVDAGTHVSTVSGLRSRRGDNACRHQAAPAPLRRRRGGEGIDLRPAPARVQRRMHAALRLPRAADRGAAQHSSAGAHPVLAAVGHHQRRCRQLLRLGAHLPARDAEMSRQPNTLIPPRGSRTACDTVSHVRSTMRCATHVRCERRCMHISEQ